MKYLIMFQVSESSWDVKAGYDSDYHSCLSILAVQFQCEWNSCSFRDTEEPINCEEEKKKLQQIVDAFDKDKIPAG